MSTELTIQVLHNKHWYDAGILSIKQPDQGRMSEVSLGYTQTYAIDWMFHDDQHACSMLLPVELMTTHTQRTWFSFIDDIIPAGAARRYWIEKLGLNNRPSAEQDMTLLSQATIAPVGNLRIKEALPERSKNDPMSTLRFDAHDVIERETNFLEYAQERGAISGGATGAGGEAPKLLIRSNDQDQVWIDTYQDEPHTPDLHYLVKFPRGEKRPLDCDILRAEYHYYHELQALGIDTIDTQQMKLHEGSRYPSLWLPRFDTEWTGQHYIRHGLESIYSLMQQEAGSFLNHVDVLKTLLRILSQQHNVMEKQQPFDPDAFIIAWVKRDLLNIAFGNADNHGRNAALLKKPDGIWLSPVYDFAPMNADAEDIVRTTKWGSPFEQAGEFDWVGLSTHLQSTLPCSNHLQTALMAELKQLAEKLLGLKQRLEARGVSQQILDMPRMGFNTLEERLARWRLI